MVDSLKTIEYCLLIATFMRPGYRNELALSTQIAFGTVQPNSLLVIGIGVCQHRSTKNQFCWKIWQHSHKLIQAEKQSVPQYFLNPLSESILLLEWCFGVVLGLKRLGLKVITLKICSRIKQISVSRTCLLKSMLIR